MKCGCLVVFALASCLVAVAQNAQGQPPAYETRVNGSIPVTLTKSLDSKKLKRGEQVIARTAVEGRLPSGVTIPAGTKVIGHVTEASVRSKGKSESSLGVVFDGIEASGKLFEMDGVIQAVGPNPKRGPDTSSMLGGNSLNGSDGGATSIGIPFMGTGPREPVPTLTLHSTGVVGIHNLKLNAHSVLTSSAKEVKLHSGSVILIRAW